MTYTIKLVRKNILGINITTKIKNVVYHAFPSDINNDGILMVVFFSGDRQMINIRRYDKVEFPSIAFLQPEKTNLTEQQKDKVNKIFQ